MPLISTLLPAYNAAGTIERAARSTLAALPRDAELVVLDDGSVDATLEVLDRIDDARLRVLSQPNAGIAPALNTLLAETDSEFVGRMDADDWSLPLRFRRQLRAMRSARTSAEVVFTTVCSSAGERLAKPPAPIGLGCDEFPFHLLLTNPVAHSSMLARRLPITTAGGYRTVPSEDYDLWLRLAAAGVRIRRLAVPGTVHRTHGRQLTAADGWRDRSWRDPQTSEAFSALAERTIGIPARRVTTLAVADLPAAETLHQLDTFAQAVRTSSAALPAGPRRRVQARLAERERWLRARIGTASGGAPHHSSPPTGQAS